MSDQKTVEDACEQNTVDLMLLKAALDDGTVAVAQSLQELKRYDFTWGTQHNLSYTAGYLRALVSLRSSLEDGVPGLLHWLHTVQDESLSITKDVYTGERTARDMKVKPAFPREIPK